MRNEAILSLGEEGVEVLEGFCMVALGLGLVAEEEGEGVGLLGEFTQSGGDAEVVGLSGVDGEAVLKVVGDELVAEGSDGVIEGVGEEAGFEAGGSEEGVLGEGEAVDGVEFLGVDGLVEGDEVVEELGEFGGVFETDDGEVGGGESVAEGVLGGAEFAVRGAGSGGAGGVGSVGGELFFGKIGLSSHG